MNVKSGPEEAEPYKALQILDAFSNDASVTQRDLSQRFGIALGLINSYVKNLVTKGYITVKAIPTKRYAYYLTPKGFAEKTRLTYHLLQDYTRIYRETRANLKGLFKEMQDSGARKVVFAGVDEVAEIAYITLQETNLELAGVVDEEKVGESFFGKAILSIKDISAIDYDYLVVTSYLRSQRLYKQLLNYGVDKKTIRIIF